MSLDNYKLHKAFTEGVVIRLDQAPDDAFLVKLPSQYNREYTRAQYEGVELDVSPNGEVTAANGGAMMLLVASDNQNKAFCNHCIVSLNGKPLPNDFIDCYPEALNELMVKANEMAEEINSRVAKTVKKSQDSSTGKTSGQARKTSTASLTRQNA